MIQSIKTNSAVCTLFEGHYHLGVAALLNSLYKNGFTGDFFIGYRGSIPPWAYSAQDNLSFNWEGVKTLNFNSNLNLHFLPVKTEIHFTNYKPEFIIKVWELQKSHSNYPGIFYFDPDIVNKCNWDFYERWITFGIALINEIVWNDMPPNHPKRHQWAQVALGMGLKVQNDLYSYINAGFIGVHKNQIGFLHMWRNFLNAAETSFNFDKSKFSQSNNDSDLFSVGDQDLLNLTAMCTDEKISQFGPEGMDFIGGGWLMSHATGSPKPWKNKYLLSLLKGKKPNRQNKEFWKNANGLISPFSPLYIKWKITSHRFASLIGRFYNQ